MKRFSSIVRSKYVFLLFLIFLCGFIYLGVAPAREGMEAGYIIAIIIGIAVVVFVAVPLISQNVSYLTTKSE
jgi:quinol-cytochrome oxidoreductase complex cytochrome b subunit